MRLIQIFYGHDFQRLLSEELIVLYRHKRAVWLLAISMNSAVAVSAVLLWPLNECFSYFTDLTMWLTLILSVTLFACARDDLIRQKTGWLAVAHAMFQTCALCNAVVVVLYWSLLHEHTLVKNRDFPGRAVHTYFSHSFPALSVLLIWWINEIRLYAAHWKGLVAMGLLYSAWNYYNFTLSGQVLYPFLDWNTHQAFVNVGLIAVGFAVVYVLLARASYWLKPIRHTKSQ